MSIGLLPGRTVLMGYWAQTRQCEQINFVIIAMHSVAANTLENWLTECRGCVNIGVWLH